MIIFETKITIKINNARCDVYENGRPCWIEVLPTRYPEKKADFSADSFPTKVLAHDGYVAHVDFAGDEAHTSGTIIIGRGADFEFSGIEKVHTGS